MIIVLTLTILKCVAWTYIILVVNRMIENNKNPHRRIHGFKLFRHRTEQRPHKLLALQLVGFCSKPNPSTTPHEYMYIIIYTYMRFAQGCFASYARTLYSADVHYRELVPRPPDSAPKGLNRAVPTNC